MTAKGLPISALLTMLLFARVSAGASPCEELKMEVASTNRCISLQNEFDIDRALISICKNFGKKDSEKLDCVRSGASVESVRFCLRMHFKSAEHSLSCLHYTNDLDVAEACARLFTKENEIIDCLKSGRDVSWVHSCEQAEPENRIRCLDSGEIGAGRSIASESKKKKQN